MKVKIEKLDHFGRGITHINDKICFIKDALPEEVVDIEIINENKKYIEAITKKVKEKSPYRIKSQCKYSNKCGGCVFNHLLFEEENKYKKEKVQEIISRFGELDKKLVKEIKYNEEYNYRNKIILHGIGNKLGFYEEKTHSIIPIDKCLLISPNMNKVIKVLNSINERIEEVLIRCNNDDSMIMVELEGKVKDIDKLKEVCDVLIYNGLILSDKDELINKIGNKKYYVSYSSFFQVNRFLTKNLYNEVLKEVKKKNPNKVLDLYTGTGTIGIYVSEYAKKIIGIDSNGSNIKNANKNKELNNVKNIEFICDKVENRINEFNNIDLIIVDPPRAGLDPKTKDYLKEIKPDTIIYVSCDPVTLARDLKELKDIYNIKSIKPFNMFPRTYHCESIAVLDKKKTKKENENE